MIFGMGLPMKIGGRLSETASFFIILKKENPI